MGSSCCSGISSSRKLFKIALASSYPAEALMMLAACSADESSFGRLRAFWPGCPGSAGVEAAFSFFMETLLYFMLKRGLGNAFFPMSALDEPWRTTELL
jgi:hypothetical protein